MPWASVDIPSLALGILRQAVREQHSGAAVEILYGNLEYVDWITEHCTFEAADYSHFSLDTYFDGFGEWVFSSALYDAPEWRLAQFEACHTGTPERRRLACAMHALAPAFTDDMTRRILSWGPDVVGFTSAFQQNTASLAVAWRVKKAAPDVVTVIGGSNCDAEQGAALHRNFPFVDFTVRGEGEGVFPRLLTALQNGGDLAGLPGLCWRNRDGTSVVNPMSGQPLPPGQIVAPDYQGYIERLKRSRAASWAEPKLVVEGARGCWWGEKHHCTFCGLNGSFMQFRSKRPEVFVREVLDLVARHRVLDLYVVDNILDMAYLRSALPALAEAGLDLRMFYEIKSNLRRDQLAVLHEGGVVHVQPGIENLSSRVLRLMDKGVSGCHNVRMLRDAETVGLTVSWNYLYGFPGETDEDYDAMVLQFPALHHLQPPHGAGRLQVERFSPYFNQPELGFDKIRPHSQYALVYDLPEAELLNLTYVFDAPNHGIDEIAVARLRAAIREWQDSHHNSRLTQCDLGDEIVLVNSRAHFDWRLLRLCDPLEVAAFRLLDEPRTAAALIRTLGEQGIPGTSADVVTALLTRWRALGLTFEDDNRVIQVASQAVNNELLRLPYASGAERKRALTHSLDEKRHGADALA